MRSTEEQYWRKVADARGRVSGPKVREGAHMLGITLLQAEQSICQNGLMPQRYARNAQSLSPLQQGQLLRSKVLLVGLGGLGGHILDMLARMGVGHIVGVDGDIFEESNTNRQLLANESTLGFAKAEAAARHVASVNPATAFETVPTFVHEQDFYPLAAAADVVVDALGGLTDRAALHKAAGDQGKTVVSAGIAGYTGWLAVVRPGEPGPLSLMGQEKQAPSAEEFLGNLAPTVTLAAALQCAEILKVLTGQKALHGLLIFDLQDQTFTKVTL